MEQEKTEAHAIYASISYNNDGEIEHAYIYGCLEFSDDDWDRIQKIVNVRVYAMHRGTAY